MGLLVVGTPLTWEDALQHLKHVRKHGVQQFLAGYNKVKDVSGDVLRWGDELEYHLVKIDHENKTVKVSLRAAEILETLRTKESAMSPDAPSFEGATWHPEYGAWMVEATPRDPYGGFTEDLRRVEKNMLLRRRRIMANLKDDELIISLPAFPLLGVGDFTDPPTQPHGPVAQSDYISDDCINPHPRFATLTANIRKRRGSKVDIRAPIFQDRLTIAKEEEACSSEDCRSSFVSTAHRDVHMDCMAFGMGMCCLQITFQARDISESRHLFDHLGVLAPIMLALSAATPILKGTLVDTDVRWATIAASVDCRTPQERGTSEDPPADAETKERYSYYAGGGTKKLHKSRYEGISRYICYHKEGNDPRTSLDKYNDVEIPMDEDTYNELKSKGIDDPLARHIAYLFCRDPLVIFSERIDLDDDKDTDHWENLQSTNWQTVRWKPPPPQEDGTPKRIGWRTEFRSMESQLTDFENAAFTVFIVLVSRVILAFQLNLYIPISKVDENMNIAHLRNAATEQKFWFRSHMAPPEAEDCCENGNCEIHADVDRCEQMSIYEILMGKGKYFPGLIPLVYGYLEHINCDQETKNVVKQYLTLLKRRASGELMTTATWIRKFVATHPDYKYDSVISQGIAYSLIEECRKIAEGERTCPELLGDAKIAPLKDTEPYAVYLSSEELLAHDRARLIQRYQNRQSILDH